MPGVAIRNVAVGDAMHGTATKVRVRPTYDDTFDSRGLPSTLIVKGGFSAHRELMYREYMLESRFYSELAPRLRFEMRVPRSVYAAARRRATPGDSHPRRPRYPGRDVLPRPADP